MPLLPQITFAAIIESVASFAGVILLVAGGSFMRGFAHRVLGFAVGALLGVAFFDILPEAIRGIGVDAAFRFVVLGIIIFFVIERFFLWYHSDAEDAAIQPYAYLILIGGTIHNVTDGVALTLSFFVSVPLGIATTAAILFHEIPHGIADFGGLVAAGHSRARAFKLAFLVSVSTVAGAVVTYAIEPFISSALPYLIAVIGGNFLYLALSDLLPETHEAKGLGHFLAQVVLMIGGVLIMYFLGRYLAA